MAIQRVSDPDMVSKSALVAEGYTDELYASLISLLPTPKSYAELHNRFEASYTASLKGDPAKVKACEADRNAINESLSLLIRVAKAVAIKDRTFKERLGLHRIDEKSATSNAAASQQPQGFKVFFDPKGQLLASVAKISGTKWYEVWACEESPNQEANWRLVAASPYCRRIVITGLNRTKTNWLRMRARSAKACGLWSTWVSLSPA